MDLEVLFWYPFCQNDLKVPFLSPLVFFPTLSNNQLLACHANVPLLLSFAFPLLDPALSWTSWRALLTFPRLSSLDNLSIRFCEWICQFPTWRRRCCARMTWRYIVSKISLPSCLLSDFTTTSFDMSRTMARCLFCFPSLGLFCILHCDSCISWWALLTVSSKKATLCPLVKIITEYVNTHTHKWSSSSFTFCLRSWGWPKCISCYENRLIKEYRRSPSRIATMKHPPIWESGSVWTLWMSGDKIIAYMHGWGYCGCV